MTRLRQHARRMASFSGCAYASRIAAVPGVKRVATTSWFGGSLPAKKEGKAEEGSETTTDWSTFFPNMAVEAEPYFALNSLRSWDSGTKPSVSLTAWSVDVLEFRVYRVNDPVRFFEQIESPHSFGGRAPRPPHETTLLERIRNWKHGTRANIRRSLRAQQFRQQQSRRSQPADSQQLPPRQPVTTSDSGRFNR
jgi:hypothetical protein